MASRKMTFTIPDEVVARLIKVVQARDRSRYVAGAIESKLREREQQLIHACEIANADPDVLAIEQDFSTLPDEIAEPWTDAPSR